MLPSTVPAVVDTRVIFTDLFSFGCKENTSLDNDIFVELSANKGMSFTSTVLSPSLVIFQEVSMVLPIFAKPMFKNGSNCSLATCG